MTKKNNPDKPDNGKTIPFSILELALISAGQTPARTFENMVDLARRAEQFGYKRFWLAEHHNSITIASSATSVLIGHVAGQTKKIRVGSGGIMLPNHSPLIVAEQFGTLGLLYPGRIDLGLGRAPGTDPETAQAIRSDRMASVLDFPSEIDRIRQYLSVNNNQSRVRIPFAEGVEVPVFVLGSSTDSAHLAAAKGLPYVFASHFAATHLFEALNIYYNEFQPSEVLQEPYSIAAVNVLAADTDEEGAALSTTLIRMFAGVVSGKFDYLQPPVPMTREFEELWEHPVLQQMLKYTFVGSKETVKEQTLDFLSRTGVNELMVVSGIFDHDARVKSYRIFSEVMEEISKSKIGPVRRSDSEGGRRKAKVINTK